MSIATCVAPASIELSTRSATAVANSYPKSRSEIMRRPAAGITSRHSRAFIAPSLLYAAVDRQSVVTAGPVWTLHIRFLDKGKRNRDRQTWDVTWYPAHA